MTHSIAVLDDASERISLGGIVEISLQRTLRLPDDGERHPLPPGLGALQLRAAGPGEFIVGLHVNEALWISFSTRDGMPCAIKVATNGVNVLSGEEWNAVLHHEPQDYVVSPPQLWLDGYNTGAETVRQFVAVPLGAMESVAEQLNDGTAPNTLVFQAVPPTEELRRAIEDERLARLREPVLLSDMGFGSGGQIVQRIYPDPYGLAAWDQHAAVGATVRLLNALQFERATDEPLAPGPIDARAYAEAGLPWFMMDDSDLGDVPESPGLRSVRPVEHGNDDDKRPLQLDPRTIRNIPRPQHPSRHSDQ